MKKKYENLELVVNEAEHQFEMEVKGKLALIEYHVQDDHKIYLTHTEVPPELEGQGIGSALVEKVLEYIKKNNLVLVPLCSFVANYVNQHDQWHSILSEGYQM
ncbi:GNAT family N-acetyltransferase [Flavobacterium sp. '19STA2R22 D10 B1']|uniref:GNAT family N-acetyltransferase n=1 Tax=Flavobacterium aerium TaxID=3037261 RepID=UPI00278C3681|nr:GNAT family N-acetyltransferase [Flavobacterium sp. '19STA2R22 D10 B1']